MHHKNKRRKYSLSFCPPLYIQYRKFRVLRLLLSFANIETILAWMVIMDPPKSPSRPTIWLYFMTTEFIESWQLTMAPTSNESILFLTYCTHASGWSTLKYTLIVRWMCSEGRRPQVWVAARTKRWISFPLVTGILNLKSKGSKFRIFWKEIIESCREEAVVKAVSCLNREISSSCSGKFHIV